jgi:hypothetical protein
MSKTEKEMIDDMYKVEPSFNGTSDDYIETYNEAMEIVMVKKSGYETKPSQYQIGIDTFDRLKANASKEEAIGFCKYNIDKYAHRKKGCDKEDIRKIKDYCDLWLWVLDNK